MENKKEDEEMTGRHYFPLCVSLNELRINLEGQLSRKLRREVGGRGLKTGVGVLCDIHEIVCYVSK